ncbi:hypothetical protein BN77_2367 [Rhizobium mesoamericanum STM3625]|uniref:Uncharacterized protein n=1 Tax=Rhizobium mesoamericanum STM3625 TaxID=1211777 RepID=K0PYZ5_9HYPH|nr:hypothetical protein BN77_2367 [Rhizobium mesoamericanum STM3625]
MITKSLTGGRPETITVWLLALLTPGDRRRLICHG